MQGGVGAALTAEFCRGVMCLNAAFISLGIIFCMAAVKHINSMSSADPAHFIFYRPVEFHPLIKTHQKMWDHIKDKNIGQGDTT